MPWGVIKQTYTIPELKYIDRTATGGVAGTGTLSLLNGLTQGTGNTNRIGRQVMMKSIHIKFEVAGSPFSATPVSPMSTVRAMIVYDCQPNGATPAVSDILETATIGFQTVSGTALRYSQRFKVLYDKRWKLNNQLTATSTTTYSEIYDEKYIKINLGTTYADTSTGTITDIDTGALFLLLTSDAGVAADNPVLLFYSRVRYTDN